MRPALSRTRCGRLTAASPSRAVRGRAQFAGNSRRAWRRARPFGAPAPAPWPARPPPRGKARRRRACAAATAPRVCVNPAHPRLAPPAAAAAPRARPPAASAGSASGAPSRRPCGVRRAAGRPAQRCDCAAAARPGLHTTARLTRPERSWRHAPWSAAALCPSPASPAPPAQHALAPAARPAPAAAASQWRSGTRTRPRRLCRPLSSRLGATHRSRSAWQVTRRIPCVQSAPPAVAMSLVGPPSPPPPHQHCCDALSQRTQRHQVRVQPWPSRPPSRVCVCVPMCARAGHAALPTGPHRK